MWNPQRRLTLELEQLWLDSSSRLVHEIAEAKLKMTNAIMFGVEARNHRTRFAEHGARVSVLADWLALNFDIHEEARRDLRAAAQLHEIGMLAIPVELVDSPAQLNIEAIGRIRTQAAISAEICRSTQSARTVRLVEDQYTDFDVQQKRSAEGSLDVLLSGILRVADAFDAVTHPRPYQEHILPAQRLRTVSEGEGTRFHPLVIEMLFLSGADKAVGKRMA
jgi:putative two-component system response regulator